MDQGDPEAGQPRHLAGRSLPRPVEVLLTTSSVIGGVLTGHGEGLDMPNWLVTVLCGVVGVVLIVAGAVTDSVFFAVVGGVILIAGVIPLAVDRWWR